MSKQLLIKKNNHGLVTLTLNRPQAAHALSTLMLTELLNEIDKIRFDKNVRCVIITAVGEKVFCAGADLKERADMDEVTVRKTVSLIRKMVNEVEALPQPVIAAINGAAFGGGTELALACDIRIAANHARFGLTETSLGIIPGAGGTQRLPRLIGKGRAKELIFTAKRIDANEAERIGLIEHVVPYEELYAKAKELASEIMKNGPVAVAQAKLAINHGTEVDLKTGLAIEQNAYEITIPTKDRTEGLLAFKEKRQPVYIGE